MDKNEFLEHIWEEYESGRLLTACAWCDRVLVGEEWVEPPGRSFLTIDARLTMSHTICPSCATVPPALSPAP